MKQQTGLPLVERTRHFLREFPGGKLNPTLLAQVYRQHGVAKRSIRWTKRSKTQSLEQAVQDTARMKRELAKAKRDGYRLVYLDECMFTRATVPKAEYCLPKQNVTLDQADLNEPTLALLSSISKEKGQELFMIFERSVDIPKFKEWLLRLREENGDDKICLFMDQLSAHTSKKSKAAMRSLAFRYVYNVAYSPDYNPIESVFSKVKQSFRALRAQKLVGNIQDDHKALVQKAVNSVRKKDIVNCIEHVQKLLK